MSAISIYLSKVNDNANPQWVTADEVKAEFMKGRTIIIVTLDGNAGVVRSVYSSGNIDAGVISGYVSVPSTT